MLLSFCGVLVSMNEDAVLQLPQKTMAEDLYDRAVSVVTEQGVASTYTLMKELNLTYSRVVMLMDEMELKEIIQPYLRDDAGFYLAESGPRKLMTPEFKQYYATYERDRLARIKERAAQDEALRQQRIEQNKSVEVTCEATVKGKRKKKA